MELIEAIIRNDVTKVRNLLENGSDPNYADDWANITPLHYAALHNALEIASLLITAGAKIDAIDAVCYETPLDIAMSCKHYDMAELLSTLQNQTCDQVN